MCINCKNSNSVDFRANTRTFADDFSQYVLHSFPVYTLRAALPFPSTRGIAPRTSGLSFSFNRLSFIYLPLVITMSPLMWDGLTAPFPHPSPAPKITCSPTSPGPLTSLHPHPYLLPHLLSSPAVHRPFLLTHSLTHSTVIHPLELCEVGIAVNWVICPFTLLHILHFL